MNRSDVLIAGAGPGGLAAAEAAALSGCSVLVLEQNKEIGSPTRTTGGSFIQDLRELGIPASLYHPIHRIRFLSPNKCAQFDYADPITCVIDVRGTFQFLAERAIDAGARIRVGTAAVAPILEDGFVKGLSAKPSGAPEIQIASSVVIDATGHRASLLKQSGVHPGYKRFGVGSEYDMYAPNIDEREGVLIVGGQIAPAGYAWAFPWGRKRVRIGVGIIHSDSDQHPEPYLNALVENSARFGIDLRGAQPVEYHYGLIPSEGLADPFVGNGIMGVGDAAGQPSALVGEGIRWAIKAGRQAGRVAAEAIAHNNVSQSFLNRYATEWNRECGRNLKIAYEINRRIASYSDGDWDQKTEFLQSLSAAQFGQALRSDFSPSWAAKVLWQRPHLIGKGLREIAGRVKSRVT